MTNSSAQSRPSIPHHSLPPPSPPAPSTASPRFEIYWNVDRLQRLARVIAGLAAVSLPLATLGGIAGKVVSLLWMAALLFAAHRIISRLESRDPILVIDRQGILDRRLQSEPIYWSDIDAVAPCNPERSRVLELYLKWPEYRLASARPLVRLGGAMQRRYGMPALTLSLLLLDCNVTGLCEAIATFRPGLLPHDLAHHN